MMAGSQRSVVVPFANENERVHFLGKGLRAWSRFSSWQGFLAGFQRKDGLQQMERYADVLREKNSEIYISSINFIQSLSTFGSLLTISLQRFS